HSCALQLLDPAADRRAAGDSLSWPADQVLLGSAGRGAGRAGGGAALELAQRRASSRCAPARRRSAGSLVAFAHLRRAGPVGDVVDAAGQWFAVCQPAVRLVLFLDRLSAVAGARTGAAAG